MQDKIKRGKITELKQDERNANLHSEHGTELLDKSLKQLGAGRSVVVSNSNELIAGNGVAARAQEAGIEDIIYVETTGKELVVVKRTDIESGSPEFYQMALADNIVAKHNIVMNAEVMEALSETVEGVSEWVASEFEAPESGKINPVIEDDFEQRVIKDPITKHGDLYELNGHRVHCADSTNAEAIEKLMKGRQADIILTDPPFGNNVKKGYGRSGLKRRTIKGDLTSEVAIDGCNTAFPFLSNDSHFLSFIQWRTYSELEAALKALGLSIKSVIVWDKKSPGLGAGIAEQYELLIVGIKGKAVQRFFTGNVWSIPRPSEKRTESEHPHKKPIELLAKALDLCVEKETLVLDMFLGSGSTVVACEQTDRVCYGQEIEPMNVDNIILRWLKFMVENNKPATLKRNGKSVLKEFQKLLDEKN